jgi:hypothetical protein
MPLNITLPVTPPAVAASTRMPPGALAGADESPAGSLLPPPQAPTDTASAAAHRAAFDDDQRETLTRMFRERIDIS